MQLFCRIFKPHPRMVCIVPGNLRHAPRLHGFNDNPEMRGASLNSGIEFFLSAGIEKGALWFGELTSNLQKAKAGVVCLTPQNLLSPWMHFEVGALFSRRKHSKGSSYTRSVSSRTS